jgi:allophanate hydrolase
MPCSVNPLSLPGGTTIEADAPTHAAVNDRVNVVVCGAHLDGLALNYQLRQRQGHLVEATLSAPAYRLYALADGKRPGMVRVSEGGRAIAVEVWALPSSELGSFLAGIPAPLGLGKVELEEGQWLTGFICENNGLEGATDITEYGGWRAWLASRG